MRTCLSPSSDGVRSGKRVIVVPSYVASIVASNVYSQQSAWRFLLRLRVC